MPQPLRDGALSNHRHRTSTGTEQWTTGRKDGITCVKVCVDPVRGRAEASLKGPPAMSFLADYGLGGSPVLGPWGFLPDSFLLLLALLIVDTP